MVLRLMRFLRHLFVALLIPVSAFAETSFVRNDSGTTAVNGSNKYGGWGGVNQYGDVSIKPFGAERSDYWQACTGDISDTTSTAIKAAGATGVKHYVTGITIMNLHATQAARVDIKDGSTVNWACGAAAGGGGCTISFTTPLVGTAATALNCQPSASATVRCCAQGFDSTR
jgi:hypothetical protein